MRVTLVELKLCIDAQPIARFFSMTVLELTIDDPALDLSICLPRTCQAGDLGI